MSSSVKELKYKKLGYEGTHYIIGVYVGWELVAKFAGYPARNPDFLILYFKKFVNFKRDFDTKKRTVHYSDIEF